MKIALIFDFDDSKLTNEKFINEHYQDFISSIRTLMPNISSTHLFDDSDIVYIESQEKNGASVKSKI